MIKGHAACCFAADEVLLVLHVTTNKERTNLSQLLSNYMHFSTTFKDGGVIVVSFLQKRSPSGVQ